jgi:hypothetical protein
VLVLRVEFWFWFAEYVICLSLVRKKLAGGRHRMAGSIYLELSKSSLCWSRGHCEDKGWLEQLQGSGEAIQLSQDDSKETTRLLFQPVVNFGLERMDNSNPIDRMTPSE